MRPPGSYAPAPVAPPGYAPPQAVPNLQWAIASYESGKRSRGLSLLIEWFIPGGGSIYGDHFRGALLTWGLMLAGVVLLVYGLSGSSYDNQSDHAREQFGVFGGLALLLGGRGYGFVNAWRSTSRYNETLRLRLGVPPQYARDLQGPGGSRRPITGRVFGPQLACRF